MKNIGSVLLFLISSCVFYSVLIEGRQMCWSCQYVLNGSGKEECSADPGNWTGGENRIKCPTKCIITAEFDAVSGDPTFIYRGCGPFQQKDGCLDSGARHSCFFSCEGLDYCNDKMLRKSPKLAKKNNAGRIDNCLLRIMCVLLQMLIYVAFH